MTISQITPRYCRRDRQPAFLTGSQLRPLLSMPGAERIQVAAPEVAATIERLQQERRI
jgi:membrane protein required for colicin V production